MKIDELTEEERREVCLHLGNMLLNLPIASVLMRHNRPLDTIRGSYLVDGPDDEPTLLLAKECLRDLAGFTTKAADLVAKWYTPGIVRRHLEKVSPGRPRPRAAP
jgi:hypothetical protein